MSKDRLLSEEELEQKIADIIASERHLVEDGFYTRIEADIHAADKIIQSVIKQYTLSKQIEALEGFAPEVDARRRADSFHESIYVTRVSLIDDRIAELRKQQEELK